MTILQRELDTMERWMQFLRDEGIIPSHVRVLMYDSSRSLEQVVKALREHYPSTPKWIRVAGCSIPNPEYHEE